MSLLYKEDRDTLSFGIWYMTESEAELEYLSGCKAPGRLTNPARKQEYLAVRALAVAMGIDPGSIDNHPSGKPYLQQDSRSISLSHTKHYAALVVADDPLIGIDIEQRTERVVRVRHKYMHPSEETALQSAIGMDTTTGLLIHWCAKEAAFKAVPEENIDFAREIRVIRLPLPVSLSDVTEAVTSNIHSGEVRFLRTGVGFQLEAWLTEEFIMTLCHSPLTDHPVSE